MKHGIKIIEVLSAAAFFRDAVQGRLQLFRVLAIGDIK